MNRRFSLVIILCLAGSLSWLALGSATGLYRAKSGHLEHPTMATDQASVILGGGCFWCIEAIFRELQGVSTVTSGYAGGLVPDPTYEQVSTGTTGHAEVVQISFDPKIISRSELLTIFFHLHDPTTKDAQGADRGTQYRSVIFYQNEQERAQAEAVIASITAAKLWPAPIVTTLEPLTKFYPAEDYHQNYFAQNRNKPYCSIVIAPKIQKLYREFADKLKG